MDNDNGYVTGNIVVSLTLLSPATPTETEDEPKTDWTYRRYSEKYDLENVARKIENTPPSNLTGKKFMQTIFDIIDPGDDLLSLNVEPGDPSVVNASESMFPKVNMSDGPEFVIDANGSRRFHIKRNKRINLYGHMSVQKYPHDSTGIKPRIIELMKQAIYDSRTKMIGMQILRDKYKYEFLWRMGFLVSKTDNRCKVYSQFAWLAFRLCIVHKQDAFDKRMTIPDLIATQERLVTIRFEIELLTDLIQENDEQARIVLVDYKKRMKYRLRGKFAN